jgi:hypothetical protein
MDVVLATLVDIPLLKVGETAGSTRMGYASYPQFIFRQESRLPLNFLLAYYPLFNLCRFIGLLAWILTMGNSRVINPW